jgi:STE24 endopeptidase
LAVLAHELSHWKLRHVPKMTLIAEAGVFFLFGLIAALRHHQPMYSAFGFVSEQPVVIGLMVVQCVAEPIIDLFTFATNRLLWTHELAADAFVAGRGRGADLASALLETPGQFISYPIFDSMYAAYHHFHPPILQRVRAIEEAANN